MLADYIKPEYLCDEIKNIVQSVRGGIPTAVFGVQASEKYHLASCMDLPVIYIARDELSAKNAARELRALSGRKAVYLPAKDDVLLYNKAFNKDSYYARIAALYELKKGADIVTVTFESLLQLIPKDIRFLQIVKGEEYPFDSLVSKLISMGYRRVEVIDGKTQFAIRGDIIQIFPINCDTPVRIDFFGDEVEKIQYFDETGNKLSGKLEKLLILPAVDFYIDNGEIQDLKTRLSDEIKAVRTSVFADKTREIAGGLTEKIETDVSDASLSFLLPVIKCMNGSIRDYMGDNAVVVYDESKLLSDSLNGCIKEHTERALSLKANGECFSFTINQLKTPEMLLKELDFSHKLALSTLSSAIVFFNPLNTFRLKCTSIPRYSLHPDDFFQDIKSWKSTGYRVIVCCGNGERAERLHNTLENKKIFSDLGDRFPTDFQGVKITSFYLATGFIYHDAKFVVIGTNDMFAAKEREKRVKRKRGDVYYAPEVGDYCVHEKHGIGIVRGVKRITTTDSTKDYVAIEYKGGDMLYVCVDNMDALTKYMGGEEKPSLSKLGGQEFERIKERVKASIARLSINLKKLYRDRKTAKGFAFLPDDVLMEEFENAFEFDETEDQLQSIEEIKKDMESTKVMDRLLCGDVGYGKTEVAFRAAFKAVESDKQVALIAPTTILAEQHYMTALKRFKGFPVAIAVLDRFRTPSEQSKTLYDLAEGKIDMIIGTHRLFSKDIKFKDLGLLILDEEQRFGVEHKEKLKLLKENVDTLTLSATPIPRTLHMSLSGIRDISIINTPPTTRIPVQIFVLEMSDGVIRDAVNKELSREGQVFILYNSVETIDKFAAYIKELLPEARVITGHGQMTEKTLEQNIYAFYRGEYDVLIATTIIENGIDLPSANTLIVIDADKMGLSTLYQLKGRVGRGDKMARAYFTYRENKVLTETAYKRLSVLTEFSDFGSGFKIAMRDLEIRGAGNVLGKEQHGHMEKIGYELYTKLLKEQLGETTKDYETETDVNVSAYIPEEYISSSEQRMDCYKQIAEISDAADKARVTESMVANYGELPAETINLIKIAELKSLCRKREVIKAEINSKTARLVLKNLDSIKNGNFLDTLNAEKDRVKLAFEENPVIVFDKREESGEKTLDFMIEFLKRCNQSDGENN